LPNSVKYNIGILLTFYYYSIEKLSRGGKGQSGKRAMRSEGLLRLASRVSAWYDKGGLGRVMRMEARWGEKRKTEFLRLWYVWCLAFPPAGGHPFQGRALPLHSLKHPSLLPRLPVPGPGPPQRPKGGWRARWRLP
jgi:hypothetical protein